MAENEHILVLLQWDSNWCIIKTDLNGKQYKETSKKNEKAEMRFLRESRDAYIIMLWKEN